MPKISIITTTYKHQDFIAETIESILAQTFTDWELLIGDDSPNDETWNIIQTYVNKYPDKIKAWHHNPNKGIVDNMNFLLEKVKTNSEYIAFLEGDDLFTKDNLIKKIEFFEKYLNIDFVYNGFNEIDYKGNIINTNCTKLYYNNLTLKEFFNIGGNFIKSFGCVCINKKILNKFYPLFTPNNDKMFGNLDYFTWLKLLPEIKFGYIQENLLFYRVHGNNFSGGSNKIKMIIECTDIYEYFYRIYGKEEQYKNILKYNLNHLNCYLSYLKKNKLKAIKYGLLSFRYSLRKNFIERVGMILFSFLPNKLNDFLYSKLKK